MKKIIAILLTLAMLPSGMTLLASCNKETPKNNDNDNEQDQNKENNEDNSNDSNDSNDSNVGGSEGNGENQENNESEGNDMNEEIKLPPDPEVEMISYNIAFYEATEKDMTVYYEGQTIADYTIEKRAKRLNALVEYFAPDVLALQEVNRLWWPYLISNEDSLINTYGYSWAGNLSAFRNKDGKGSSDNDLFNLLLWDTEKFEEIKSGVFRLGDRLTGSANKDRLCTYAILKNRTTGVEILYASTHLCTRPDAATNQLSISQATRLTERLTELAEGRMIVVGGDFNADNTTDTYKYMTKTAGFLDTRVKARTRLTQKMCSARVWGREQNWNNGRRTPIDHIFYLGTSATPEKWTVLTETYDKDNNVSVELDKIGVNFDLSDHQGIYVKFRENIE